MEQAVNLSVEISGLRLKNPVLAASGTFGYGLEFTQFFDISQLGGFCTKGLSLEPMAGNPPSRIVETPAGMLNAIGLENVGVKDFIREKLPLLVTCDTHTIANIFGKTIEEFVTITELLNSQPKVSALEMNISCPNVQQGGVEFGHDPELTYRVVNAVKRVALKPVWVKLSPNVTDITIFAQACEQAGADSVTLVNTFLGMSIDTDKGHPRLSNLSGGLSGPAIRPLAVRLVHQAAAAVNIPVIGIGGITSTRDALEFLIAGATAVQVGTANFFDPLSCLKVVQGLRRHCQQRKIADINSLVDSMKTHPVPR